MTTIRHTWTHARDRLTAVSTSPALDAQVLLADVVGADNRAYLLAHPERVLTPEEQAQYEANITRRLAGEPVAYIRGFKDWYDRQILVTPDVLIPRPETELLLEAALERTATQPDALAADICTGSGAIAVTLKANAPRATVYGTDISGAALAVAQRNAHAANVDVTWLEGDLLAPLLERDLCVDILAANPPYITTDEMHTLDVAAYEPHLALDGGPDGLDFVRRLLADAPRVLNPGALVLIEIGAGQGAQTLALAEELLHPAHAEIVPDYAGLDRFLRAVMPSSGS
ncbi:MAG: peptide chain release factor N(5)-glutamine methyltransferase [Chloroflexota bacterium]